MRNRHIYILIISFLSCSLEAQFDTDGLKVYKDTALDGYAMFETFNRTYLIDNCGMIVNTWNVTNTHLHTKLLPNGNLIYIRDGQVYIRDWENTLVEFFVVQPSDANITLVYEVIEMPNKNLLCAARQYFQEEDFEAIGYEFSQGESAYFMDAVVELDRVTGEIVWMWSIADHVIQARDSNVPNFGVLEDNPQLLNMDAIATYDWTFEESFMINGMDYNPELDHIALSVRKMSEVVIIDHSTTTEEAMGSTGGNSGMGGDILYRWGNPQNYNHGTEEDRFLFFQHNPNWIQYGDHKGKLILYNNGLSREPRYSEGIIINPPYDSTTGQYTKEDMVPFTPTEPVESYSHNNTDMEDLFSGYTSAAKVLPNGHILFTEGDDSEMTEITPEGEIVWQYNIPTGYIFRGEKYAKDYPGLAGQNLSGNGTIESPPSDVACEIVSSTEVNIDYEIEIRYSASKLAELYNPEEIHYMYRVVDIQGRQLQTGRSNRYNEVLDLRGYQSGMAVISMYDITTGRLLQSKQVVL